MKVHIRSAEWYPMFEITAEPQGSAELPDALVQRYWEATRMLHQAWQEIERRTNPGSTWEAPCADTYPEKL